MWTNKKYKGLKFEGNYSYYGKRHLLLLAKSGTRKFKFQSHQAAKSDGWVYRK